MEFPTLLLDRVSQHKLRELCKLASAKPHVVIGAAIAALFVERESTILRVIASFEAEGTPQNSGGAASKDSLHC